MFSLIDCKTLFSITLVVCTISGWQIIQSQPYSAAHNFDGYNQFSTFQHYMPFQQIPRNNRHFYHSPSPRQQHNYPPQQNFNQNIGTDNRINNSKWVTGHLVFATTTSAPQAIINSNNNQPVGRTMVQQQNSPPYYNYNQNSAAGNHLNRNKWVDGPLVFATTTSGPPTTSRPQVILGKDMQPTVQFIPSATTSTPEFLDCFARCPTTSEYNPVCANNRQQYHNEQKFFCAKRCGQDIQIVRHGSCMGLFPVTIG
ncbi:hypothetical protein DOY81_006753 [Sarcophaga bullata]|nr:hypothetical protein DOY81_006753 [Sarcophaga bullata]